VPGHGSQKGRGNDFSGFGDFLQSRGRDLDTGHALVLEVLPCAAQGTQGRWFQAQDCEKGPQVIEIGAREKDQGVDAAFLQSLGQRTQLMVVLILNLSVHENTPEACRNLNLMPPLEKLPIDNLEVLEGFHVPGMGGRIQLRCLDGPLKGDDKINKGCHGKDATSFRAE
jgi:hypothetical protein